MNQYFRKISKAFDASYLSSLSKRDLKHSGIFFESVHANLDSQLIKYFAQKALAGRLAGSKPNILHWDQNSFAGEKWP